MITKRQKMFRRLIYAIVVLYIGGAIGQAIFGGLDPFLDGAWLTGTWFAALILIVAFALWAYGRQN